MIKLIKYLIGSKPNKKDDFADFFTSASSRHKAKIIRQVMREANLEQKRMVDEYRKKIKAA